MIFFTIVVTLIVSILEIIAGERLRKMKMDGALLGSILSIIGIGLGAYYGSLVLGISIIFNGLVLLLIAMNWKDYE